MIRLFLSTSNLGFNRLKDSMEKAFLDHIPKAPINERSAVILVVESIENSTVFLQKIIALLEHTLDGDTPDVWQILFNVRSSSVQNFSRYGSVSL